MSNFSSVDLELLNSLHLRFPVSLQRCREHRLTSQGRVAKLRENKMLEAITLACPACEEVDVQAGTLMFHVARVP